jgi:mannose-6-phosphate isomerase-like protein (cupin superfamily)
MTKLFLAVLLVSAGAIPALAQAAGNAKKGGKGAPAPLSTSIYDVWTMEQLAKPGNLGNFGNHSCSVQRRDVGAAPEAHDNFAHIMIFTSGTGSFQVGGEIVDGPEGKKIVRGGEQRKIVVGEVYHLPIKTAHWVIADPGSSVTYFVCNLYIQ